MHPLAGVQGTESHVGPARGTGSSASFVSHEGQGMKSLAVYVIICLMGNMVLRVKQEFADV